MEEWTIEDVCTFVQGSSQEFGDQASVYAAAMKEQAIDGKALLDLSAANPIADNKLKELGLKVGHRIKLKRCVQGLQLSSQVSRVKLRRRGRGRSILALIAEARATMKVRGRDAMMREAEAIWVLSGSGELLGSTTVTSVAYRRDAVGRIVVDDGLGRMQPDRTLKGKIRSLLEEVRTTMKVRGRDAMLLRAERRNADGVVREDEEADSDTLHRRVPDASVERAKNARDQLDAIIKREQAGLAVLYQHLLAPVAPHLEGSAEVLIVPHQELSEVPWAALFDSQAGQYLIERHVLRVAPSLRVVREAAGAERHAQTPRTHASEERPGRSLVVGNPLPNRLGKLIGADAEAKLVARLLRSVGVEVDALMRGAADKAAVLDKIQGAEWAHFACHGDMDAKSLVLMSERRAACPQHHEMQRLTSSSSWMCDVCKKDMTENPRLRCDECGYDVCAACVRRQRAKRADLSMKEVQGRVRMRAGSTAVLSACNWFRGVEVTDVIKAEGVIGLARAFLFACVAAIVVSLWSVSAASRHAAPCAHHTSHICES